MKTRYTVLFGFLLLQSCSHLSSNSYQELERDRTGYLSPRGYQDLAEDGITKYSLEVSLKDCDAPVVRRRSGLTRFIHKDQVKVSWRRVKQNSSELGSNTVTLESVDVALTKSGEVTELGAEQSKVDITSSRPSIDQLIKQAEQDTAVNSQR